MIFNVEISDKAKKQIEEFKRSDIQSFKKVESLIEELFETPTSGTGNPKPLRGNFSNYWSRRINKKDRLVYRIDGEEITVFVVSAKGHYDDK